MAARSLARQVGITPACRALGVSRSTFYRRARPAPGRQQPRPTPARALSKAERKRVEATLASPRFVDRSPAEVVATLLDEGQYLCTERTMYRILEANHPVRDRRNQRVHPSYAKPELVATAPRSGPGTSPGSSDPRPGPTTTSTSCSTSSAATRSAGWLPTARTPPLPRDSSSRPSSSTASSQTSSHCTPIEDRP